MTVTSGPTAGASKVEHTLYDFVDSYDRAYEAAAASQQLSVAQACVLVRLDQRRGMSSLATELGCDASNITQIVARLESRGFVTRHADPADGRARLIDRTPDGDAVSAGFDSAFEFAREAMKRLSAEEQDHLTALLRKALGG
ncbi:MarR family winged helix-turn-helix transcriptional regulator [Agromyces laixinhei]|uniref:MarR family winged helix-turn-helix transcriptional regulator n=1 Tax=Agromyces laixinhei TaxID=2585717 RepID=UPI0011175A97|nr:MarR family transcriptional regulator [Agromyces laixinhei]